MNQVQLEAMMVRTGRASVNARLASHEYADKASNNPYAQLIYRLYLEPVAEYIKRVLQVKPKSGATSLATRLLMLIDANVLAYLSLREIINTSAEATCYSTTVATIGRTVYGEYLLRSVKDIEPSLFHAIIQDIESKKSADTRYRIACFQASCANNNVAYPLWESRERSVIGAALVEALRFAGVVEFRYETERTRSKKVVEVTAEVQELIDKAKIRLGFYHGFTLPCKEEPLAWTNPNHGGYHTEVLRRCVPCIFTRTSRVDEDSVPQRVLDAVNKLQAVAWKVNNRVLDAVLLAQNHINIAGVLEATDDKPEFPMYLENKNFDDYDEADHSVYKEWKKAVSIWYSTRGISHAHMMRTKESVYVANMFKDDERIYFVYQMDYRGRTYARSRGITPQGSDLQRALIHAADGAALSDSNAVKWFCIQGANKYGFDKAPLADRVQWVMDNKQFIRNMAKDPIVHREWTEADKPFQFLAWCFEFDEWCSHPDTFVTRLPISMDGSCNGLQHYSAMLRDAVGGASTNLTYSPTQQDIYARVAEVTAQIIQAEDSSKDTEHEAHFRKTWLSHGINRTLVKRSVMTLPYGSTRYSCAEFIKADYLAIGKVPEFTKTSYTNAANWLSWRVWAAITKVVIKAREAMEWLQRSSDELIKAGVRDIEWVNPIGLHIKQVYRKATNIRIQTYIAKSIKIQCHIQGEDETLADKARNRNGIAPNFVHSCDSAHMMATINSLSRDGIDFMAMIHDDYGVLAPHAEKLYQTIRKQFVTMYETCDPLALFFNRYKDYLSSEPPAKGSLDLYAVMKSQYFFC